MSVAVRSTSSTSFAARTNTTIAAPAGIQDGDILVCVVQTIKVTTPVEITLPDGFTAFAASPLSFTNSSYQIRVAFGWKVAAGESGDYTATHAAASTGSQGSMFAISGASNSTPGNTAVSGTGATATATGLTTTANNALVGYFATNWNGWGATLPPSGSTPTYSESLRSGAHYLAAGILATAGATGNSTVSTGNSAAQPWSVLLFAFNPAGPSIPVFISALEDDE